MPPMNRFIPLLWVALAAAPAGVQAAPAAGHLLDSYAAIVNGKVITVGEVLSLLQPVQERLSVQYSGQKLEEKILEEYDTIRNALIESELILMDFKIQGGALPDRAIEDHINTVIHDRFGNDRTAFLKALAEERLTYSEWRKQMKDQLIVQIMRQQEVTSKILITPLDLQTAYDRKQDTYFIPERVKLRILALPADTPPANAVNIRDQFLSGKATFEQAVTNGATLQDDAEWIETTSLHESIRNSLTELAPGGISKPVEIDGILYLAELVERQAGRVQPFDEVVPELERELRRAEFDRLNRIWIDSLRTKYFVQIFSHNLFD